LSCFRIPQFFSLIRHLKPTAMLECSRQRSRELHTAIFFILCVDNLGSHVNSPPCLFSLKKKMNCNNRGGLKPPPPRSSDSEGCSIIPTRIRQEKGRGINRDQNTSRSHCSSLDPAHNNSERHGREWHCPHQPIYTVFAATTPPRASSSGRTQASCN
jgi:hypothetical protein